MRTSYHTQLIFPPAGQLTLADYIQDKRKAIDMKTVYIEHTSAAYGALFRSLGFNVTSVFAEADLVCFTGGEDVSPELYGDVKHPYTHNNAYRDEKESKIFKACKELGIPMVGICRGGQFLNVMSGGRMYQHVDRHGGDHEIIDSETGETILVSSTHHQMMMMGSEGHLVASSNLLGKREWYDNEVFKRDVSDIDIEVVYYHNTKCLCFQPHPEFTDERYTRMRSYFHECIQQYLEV